jgi:hypothetical protein
MLAALLTAWSAAAQDASPAQAPAPAPAPGQASAKASQQTGPQRLDLEASSIRGNQELPKVLYIVPWKEPGLVEPAGRPLNSLVDEALAPVDRDVFRRQMSYFGQLYGPAPAAPGDGVAAP